MLVFIISILKNVHTTESLLDFLLINFLINHDFMPDEIVNHMKRC